jgi:hypothetical protein
MLSSWSQSCPLSSLSTKCPLFKMWNQYVQHPSSRAEALAKKKAPLPGANTAVGLEPAILDQDRWSHTEK